MQIDRMQQNAMCFADRLATPGCVGKFNEKARLLRIPFRQFFRDHCQQFPFLQAVINGETGDQHLRQMSAERIDFLQFRIRFLEHPNSM